MGNIKTQDPNKSKGRAVSLSNKRNSPISKALRRLRAHRIVEDRIMGLNIKDLSFKYNIGCETVTKELKFAKEIGIIDSLEDRILKELVPLAIETYKIKMSEDRDAYVAKDVLTNLARLSEKQERKQKDDDTNSLEAYIKLRSPNTPPALNSAESKVTVAKSFAKAITATLNPQDSSEGGTIDVNPITETNPQSIDELSGSSEDDEDDEDVL
jgi:hypothetical protein